MKQYVGFVRDHSASMRSLGAAAARDYNGVAVAVTQGALNNDVDTIVSVVECGYEATSQARFIIRNSSVLALSDIRPQDYTTNGRGTPLLDAVGMLIKAFKAMPDANDVETSFLIMATTDGDENCSLAWSWQTLQNEMRKLQATDRWTFTFRVPRGYARNLASRGIPAANIMEWEQTEQGMERARVETQAAINTFYEGKAAAVGQSFRSTSFYAGTEHLKTKDVEKLQDITTQVTVWDVDRNWDGMQIREFIETQTNVTMQLGEAYYELAKPEKAVQDHKKIVIRNKVTGRLYSGPNVRSLLGLPTNGTVAIHPGDQPTFDVFIQSTSNNRKLYAGTQVMYWPNGR